MAVSRCTTCASPEDAQRALRQDVTELLPTGADSYRAEQVEVNFTSFSCSTTFESVARLKHSLCSAPSIEFLLTPGSAMIIDGMAVPFGAIMRHPPHHGCYEYTTAGVAYGTIILPQETIANEGCPFVDADLAPPSVPLLARPSPRAMEKLLHLHRAIEELARSRANVLATDCVAHRIAEDLLVALRTCLADCAVVPQRYGQLSRSRIMQRLHHVLATLGDEPVGIPDLCAALGVPERTLRICCQEQLGMSPKRYLLLRRMHLARRALLASRWNEITVTEVAMRYGFWHLGRFSSYYRAAFGESPSATLGHGTGACLKAASVQPFQAKAGTPAVATAH